MWRLSPVQLRTTRSEATARARAQIAAIRREEGVPEDADGLLTPDEDATLCQYYYAKCTEVCLFVKLPDRVLATAVTYAKRFYLQHSAMDYHPKDLILTAIFLACKTEENYLTLADFLKRTSQPPTLAPQVLALEVVLMQALHFDLVVAHPYEALYGFYLQLRAAKVFPDVDNTEGDVVAQLYRAARALVALSFASDVGFVFQPAQIALAALDAAAKERRCQDAFFAFLQHRCGGRPQELAQLSALIEQVQTMIQGTLKVSADAARPLGAKLAKCRNPAHDPDSAYYKRQREQEEREAAKRGMGRFDDD